MTMTEANRLQDDLEAIVDEAGITAIVDALEAIAHAKAEHVSHAWQDDHLSRAWTRIAKHLGAARARIAQEGI
jgi:NAD-dependent oxidoreductase involved in siderophore biosynthesis